MHTVGLTTTEGEKHPLRIGDPIYLSSRRVHFLFDAVETSLSEGEHPIDRISGAMCRGLFPTCDLGRSVC